MVIIDAPHKNPVENLIILLVIYSPEYEARPSITVDRKNIDRIIRIYKGGRSFCFLLNIIKSITAAAINPIYIPAHLEQTGVMVSPKARLLESS
jgi:hypothetical protein